MNKKGGGAAVKAMRVEVIRKTTAYAGNDSLTEMPASEQAKLFSEIAELAQTPRALKAWMGIAVNLQESHAAHNLTPEEVRSNESVLRTRGGDGSTKLI